MREMTRDGLTFTVPDAWRADVEASPDGWTLTLQSPGAAFAVVRLDRNLPDPAEMLAAALEGFRSEYRELEVEPALETIAGDLALGHDLEFLSLDLDVVGWLRAFHGPAGTVLVVCQVPDAERVEHEPPLRALTASMRVEEE